MATAIINAAPRLQWFELRFTEDPRKIRCDCLVCKKPMWFPKSKAGKYVTCGGVCAQKRFEEMALWRVRVCGVCGSTFIPRKTQLDAGKGVTCSQKCNAATNSALNSAESHAKSKLAWKQRNAASPIFKSGVENPCWTGGKAASYQRLRESGRTRIYNQNRKRSKGVDRLSEDIVQTLGALQKWRCAICKCSVKGLYHVDHIEPLSRGGRNINANVQLLCPPCNLKKHARDPIEYMQSLGWLL